MNIGYIGHGMMGKPMAQNPPNSGHHSLTVYGIDAGRAADLGASFYRLQPVHRRHRGELYFGRTHAVVHAFVQRAAGNRTGREIDSRSSWDRGWL